MTLTITDLDITSDRTQHTAHTPSAEWPSWYVSWFPHLNPFTRDQAITALLIAEVVLHDGIDHPEHPSWMMVANWCVELDVEPCFAVDMLKTTAH